MSEAYTLVTGATSGIGRSIAQKLSGSRKLLLSGRNVDKLDSVRGECENTETHLTWASDLSQPGEIGGDLATRLLGDGLCIEHFVHSAGIFEIQAIRSTELAKVHAIFNVNLFSAIEIIRQLVRQRVNKGTLRSITLISSIASHVGAKGYSAYAASKGAVNALVRSLAVELAPEIRVNAILPGGIETEGTRQLFANREYREAVSANYPLGFGKASDIADVVDFIISEKARWITGQELVVDGGRSVL